MPRDRSRPSVGEPILGGVAPASDNDSRERDPSADTFPCTRHPVDSRGVETLRVLGQKFELKGALVEATQGIDVKSAERGSATLIERLLPDTLDR